jgi:hypothetical protein
MKKWLVVLLSLFVLFIACVYFIVPNPKQITKTALIRCSPEAAYRYLLTDTGWNNIWPVQNSHSSSASLVYDSNVYKVEQKTFEGFIISVRGLVNTETYLKVLSLRNDSVGLEWKAEVATSANPFRRLAMNARANTLSADMSAILRQFKTFFEQPKNIYGIDVKQQKVRDSILMTIKQVSDQYPTTDKIYRLIGHLRTHIEKNTGKETNYPMLHIDSVGHQYTVMVGIPVNKVLNESGDIVLKRMVLGNILEAEVQGGTFRVNQAAKQLEHYVSDYKYSSPAIPFQQLVTNRLQEPDSSRWITRLYYPVF